MMEQQNHHPSLPIDDAETVVRRENGFVQLVYMTDMRNGCIRYTRQSGGRVLVQMFHRTWIEALRGRKPFRA